MVSMYVTQFLKTIIYYQQTIENQRHMNIYYPYNILFSRFLKVTVRNLTLFAATVYQLACGTFTSLDSTYKHSKLKVNEKSQRRKKISKYPIFRTNFRFPWRFEKSGFSYNFGMIIRLLDIRIGNFSFCFLSAM